MAENDKRNTTRGKSNCIKYIRQQEEEYPEKLRVLHGMPKGLYLLGSCPNNHKPSVAIVGARRSSTYGNEIARIFSRELALAGVQIISGMAWGIDGYAHEGALEAGKETFAVLGCGVDICYPAGHRRLYERIIATGGVLSEQPLGMAPMPQNFPARNRIISGLADLVLVVEAREKSGALITADFALEQGKDVYAVPGRIGDELSKGCLNLLKQGAGLADSPQTLLEALHISVKKEKNSKQGVKILLAKDENFVYSFLRLQPKSLEELVVESGFPAAKLMPILVELQLKGCIKEVQRNLYIRFEDD